MCQSVWYNPTSWGCGVSNAWNSLTSAFQKRVAGPFVTALMHLFFSLIHIVVYAILDGLTTLIKTELSLITDASKSLGILSLPVFAGLFVAFFSIMFLVAGEMKDIPVLDVFA